MYRFLFLLTVLFFHTGCEDDLKAPPPVEEEEVVIDDFSNIPALEEMVIYEVNMRAFSQSGTFKGVEARLDHIGDMGANVIWLMPIYPIGQERGINSPYSIRDYQAVNPEYGTLNDLKGLVNAAHERDMAVILDWVANHTAWDHPWASTHPEWYAQDGNGNIIAPPGTGWTDVAELNYDNSAMRQEMIRSMKYWLDNVGIDGFRCDAADFVPDTFWRDALATLKATSDKDLILLAEGSEPENFTAGFEMDYAWDFYTSIKEVFGSGNAAQSIISTHLAEYEAIPGQGEKLRYITNHDLYAWENTPIADFGRDGAVSAFVITSFLGGVPLIYTGQEIAHPSNIDFLGRDPLDWSVNMDIYDAYKKIMSARAGLSAVHTGAMESYTTTDVVAFRRFDGDREVMVVVNVRERTVDFSWPEKVSQAGWRNALTGLEAAPGETLSLDPFEYRILSR